MKKEPFSNDSAIDVVLPLMESAQDCIELRYALRSMQKHLSGIRNLYLVGYKPTWIKNASHIPANDRYGAMYKEFNIYSKIRLACQDERVSNDFILYNDDNFLTANFQADKLPLYHKGSIQSTLQRRIDRDLYLNTMINTSAMLKAMGKPQTDFDNHFIITLNKTLFLGTLDKFKWDRPWGFGIKSLYCNILGLTGFDRPDLKIKAKESAEVIHEQIRYRTYFSTHEVAVNEDMIKVWKELYPNKSKYEK